MQEVSLQDLLKDFVEVMGAATDMQAVLDTVGKEHQLWTHSKNRFSIRLNRSNQLHLMNEDPLMVQDLKYRYYEIVTMQQFDQIVLGFLKFYESNLQRLPISLPVGDVGEQPIMEEPAYQTFSVIKLTLKKRYAFLRQWILETQREQQGNQGAQNSTPRQLSKSVRSVAIPQREAFFGSFDSPLSMSQLLNQGEQSEQLQEAKVRRTSRVSAVRKQSLDNSIDSLKESHISQQRNMIKGKSNLKTKQHQLNQEHLEKNRNCCIGCCQF